MADVREQNSDRLPNSAFDCKSNGDHSKVAGSELLTTVDMKLAIVGDICRIGR
jgi:hypothetical protein